MVARTGPWSTLPVRRVEAGDSGLEDERGGDWHLSVPAVRQVLEQGWDLGPATVLVGDNGTGKSTLVEGIARAFGMAAEGGSTGSMHRTRPTESGLAHDIRLVRGAGAPKRGFFLRAETMHGFYTYLDAHPSGYDPEFHAMSHGESFLELIGSRMKPKNPGLYVLDEPESALSFTGSLALLQHLHALVRHDSQVILSTHSPLLAALPGATIYEVGEWGLRECAWEDLDLVVGWRGFLDDPQRYLRHVLKP
ncbi:AAA family ATPase [Cellulomonas sp. zg-ZUI22]|uniref:AAA family ATPase n=1 Tax=Cellulomonas sp. zg-ZUI22 TaxID=2816955 RepID=UPI001A9533E6|nr:AAA family ATPase [Cellulomonas sp. zg-ZUI22]MBO0899099.1 AAA family ATPase [Cellulomonas sp. zg-ZUI22]